MICISSSVIISKENYCFVSSLHNNTNEGRREKGATDGRWRHGRARVNGQKLYLGHRIARMHVAPAAGHSYLITHSE